MLAGDIDRSDYKTIKLEAEKTMMRLEAKLTEIPSKMMSINEVEEVLGRAIDKLTKLDLIYWKSDIKVQIRSLVRCSSKFTFDKMQHQTAKTDFLFQHIQLINSRL